MDRIHALSAFGALAFAGAVLGVHVGQSAIDQINPLYFQGAPVHPRDRGAAVDESLPAPERTRFADHYGFEEGEGARAADCGDCAALHARDLHAQRSHFAVIETGWRAAPQQAAYAPEAEPEAQPAGQAAPAERTPIELYSSFQIEEKPTATEAAPAEPVAAQE